jgi:hypothetical protein
MYELVGKTGYISWVTDDYEYAVRLARYWGDCQGDKNYFTIRRAMAHQIGTKVITVDGQEHTVRVFSPGKARYSECVSDIERELAELRLRFIVCEPYGRYPKKA